MKVIAISGSVGVGKTTLIKENIKRYKNKGLKVGVVYELWEDTEDTIFKEKPMDYERVDYLLKEYYEYVKFLDSTDMEERFDALATTLDHQGKFVTYRSRKIIKALKIANEENYDVVLLDRTHMDDIIFTKLNLFNEPLFWESYEPVWNLWNNRLKIEFNKYDFYNVVLTANNKTMLDRIVERGREMEQDNDDYFSSLNNDYANQLVSNCILNDFPFIVYDNSSDKVADLDDIINGDKKYDIYLASGWFNEKQANKEEMIYNKLIQKGLKVFSPRRDVKFNVSNENEVEDLTQTDATAIFNEDIKALNECKQVFAIVDEFDSGTMWEMGYAYAKGIPVEYIYLDSNENTFNNLMITESAKNNTKTNGKWHGKWN